MPSKLEGKVALITGGTSGIGLATARLFMAEGARVFITGRRQAELETAIGAIGPTATGIKTDSAKLADLDALYAQVAAEAGRLDVLFANAGGGSFLPLGDITEEQYDDTFERNVKGVLFTVQKALPLLREKASVIVTGSTAASGGTPGFSVYAASKAALRAMVRSWVVDLRGREIRVNVLSPGPTRTPGLIGLAGQDADRQRRLLDDLAAGVPLGRVGEPDEIARAALFLASEDSSFVHGTEIFVDGGEAQI